jgi:hypothetical protein
MYVLYYGVNRRAADSSKLYPPPTYTQISTDVASTRDNIIQSKVQFMVTV